MPAIRALLLMLLLCGSAVAREAFTRFGEDQGLRSAAVYGVVQDASGFLWVSGSSEGLFRFDGSEFRLFTPWRSEDLVDGRSPDTGSLLRDDRDRIWVTTWGYGVFVLSADRQQATRYQHDPSDPDSLASNQAQSLHQSADGSVWLGTTQGLNRVWPDGRIERVTARSGDDILRDQRVWSIASDPGTLWIATSDGLYALRLADFELRVYRLAPPAQAGERGNEIRTLARLSDGSLWAGTRQGPMRFEPQGGRFQPLLTERGEGGLPRVPPVNALVETRGGELLAGTQAGVFRVDPARRSLLKFHADDEAYETMGAYDIRSLALDHSDLLWIGTRQGELFRGAAEQRFAGLGGLAPALAGTLAGRAVRAVWVDDADTLWLGTAEGVFGVDLADGSHRRLVSSTGAALEGAPLGILPAQDGGLWIATDAGLYRKPAQGDTAAAVDMPMDDGDVSGSDVRSLALGRDGALLVGLWNQGAVRWRPGEPARWLLRGVSGNPGDSVYAILEDDDGSFWVGSRYSGLFRVDAEGRTLEHFFRGPDGNDAGLPHNGIYCILRTRDRALWVCTDDGLARRPHGRERFEVFTREQGLPSNRIVGALEDDRGTLWVLTRGGLGRRDAASGEIVAFRRADGLPSNEFHRAAVVQDRHGRIHAGTTEGLARFDPHRTYRNAIPPTVVITGIQVDSQAAQVDAGRSANAPLRLPRGSRTLAVRYAALDFNDFEANRYRHRLLGFESEWQQAGTQRLATYTNLAPGDYRLEIEGTNNHGLWSEQPAVLHLRMEAGWWQTLWGQAALAFGVLGVAAGIPGLRLSRARALARRLEQEVRHRTSELSEKNSALEDALEQVRRLSHTDPLTQIGNRRFLQSHVGGAAALAVRRHDGSVDLPEAERPRLHFVLVDIDHFKRVNDGNGHAVGDALLQAVARTLQLTLRESDTVVRWGGEEFLIAAPMTSFVQASALATRILAQVAATRVPTAQGHVGCTCSVGLCAIPLFDAAPQALEWEDAVSLADYALYHSKSRGRNRWTAVLPGPAGALTFAAEAPRRIASNPAAAEAAGEIRLVEGTSSAG